MVRPKIPRKIKSNPNVTYFKPRKVPLSILKEVSLNIDELEAIKLCDHLGLGQAVSAKKMNVSQSTMQRILSSARKKTSEALVKGMAIKINTPNIS